MNLFYSRLPRFAHTSLFASLLLISSLPSPTHAQAPKGPFPRLVEDGNPEPTEEPPAGWEIRILPNSDIASTKILKNKRKIKVNVEAYELVPIATNALVIAEPGFDPALGVQQKNTTLSVLNQSIDQITLLQSQIEAQIKQLETALGSNPPALTPSKPNPSSTPSTPPSADPKPAPK